MANNYLEFSEVLPDLRVEEVTWLKQQLQPIVVVGRKTYSLDAVPVGIDSATFKYRGPRFLHNTQTEVWGDEPEFQYEFEEPTAAEPLGQLWFYSEAYGSLDQVVLLVRKFLKQFRPGDIWSLGYAASCSKPRVGEFGGGVVLVTAQRVRWHDSDAIAARAIKAHYQKHPRAA